MVDRVLHDSFQHGFVRIAAFRNLFRQTFNRETPDFLFEQIATLVPADDEFVPWDQRLGPFLYGLPTREGIAVAGDSYSFVPKK
jgi:hypothetical protein